MLKKLIKLNKLILLFFLIFILFLWQKNSDKTKSDLYTKKYNVASYHFNKENNCSRLIYFDETNEKSKFKSNRIDIDLKEYHIKEIEKKLSRYFIKNGGEWSPPNCISKFKIAIVIPYRNRLSNLKVFLANMHLFFISQYMSYRIFLIEPLENLVFNRGLLMNIGYKEAVKLNEDYDCIFFHDVDMIAEDRRNIYTCDQYYPVHYAVSVSKHNNYSTEGYYGYGWYFGGINAFTREQFEKINGFSNSYYGWGAEDDDLKARVLKVFKKYTRRIGKINRYFTPTHDEPIPNKQREDILHKSYKKYNTSSAIEEGLTTMKYTVKKIEKYALFTRFLVYYPSNL